MQALIAYDEDSGSDTERHRRSSPSEPFSHKPSNGKQLQPQLQQQRKKPKNDHDGTLSAPLDNNAGATLDKLKRSPKPKPHTKNVSPHHSIQLIRRPNQTHARLHPRMHSPSPTPESSVRFTESQSGPSSLGDREEATQEDEKVDEEEDELTRIRALLRPPPIPGLQDWGIPPPSSVPCDPELEAKLQQFFDLKRANPPKHFNDSLMSNRTFRNPHLYAKLVEFVDVDEKGCNIPKGCWDMDDLGGWDAEKIASAQKRRSEQQTAAQAPGKRHQIAFTASSSSAAGRATQAAAPLHQFRSSTSSASAPPPRKERKDGRKYEPYEAPRKPRSRWG